MNCFDCKIPCEYSNPLGYCYKEQSGLPNGPKDKGYTPSGVPKEMLCKWYCAGECKKGLPGTKCELKGCVAWEHYEPVDAMKLLEEKIKLVSEKKTWEGVDVDKYLAEIRGENTELYKAASDLVDAVERYMCQECLRSELAMKKDKLKGLLK